jgi:tetratricopeptide (TPR) repeat protein
MTCCAPTPPSAPTPTTARTTAAPPPSGCSIITCRPRTRRPCSLAITLESQSRYADGLSHAQQALELFTAAGDRQGQAISLNGVGWFHAHLGNHRQALSYCGQALRLHTERGGSAHVEAGIWDSLGYAHHHLGDHGESAACYQRALDLYGEIGDRWGEADTLGHIGDAQHAAGHRQQARASWERALAILDDLHHPHAARSAPNSPRSAPPPDGNGNAPDRRVLRQSEIPW